MVGDKLLDLVTATNAGTRGVFVKTGKPFTDAVASYTAEHDMGVFDDLAAFVDQLETS